MYDLGDLLKELRIKNELTQEELASKLNLLYGTKLNKGMISKWESNKSEPRFEYVKHLSKLYDVSLDYLLGLSPYKNKDEILKEHKSKLLTSENNCSKNLYESKILKSLDLLNDLGKKEAVKRISELTEISKYVNDKDFLEPIAAHLIENSTIENIKHDDELMDNDAFWNE